MVQVLCEQRKRKPRQCSQESCYAGCARRVAPVCVYDIRLAALEADDEADGEYCGPDVGDDPVDFVLGGPAVEEEADGDEEAAGDHEWDAEFGASGVVVVSL